MQKKPTKGSFLIANPRLQDPNFKRAVVLICEYNEEGAFGLVINRALNMSVSELLKDNPCAIGKKGKIFNGGPVHTNHLLYLHNNDCGTKGSKKIYGDMHLGGDINCLNNLLSYEDSNDNSYRLYLGSAGWAPGQLDEELKISSWIVCPASESFIFHPEPDEVWREVLHSMGGTYALLSTYPADPNLN